ncbi:50S ribosomal protein L10 [candidate division KSB1 bacterium 4484_87]|nr:MAG: 50S ribosomal protein L10 [candidate division KSB1 bacterium 4484_87]
MARPEKEKIVEEIAEKITQAKGVYLADYKGLDVEEISELRSKLREAEVEFKVVKNTLARLSVNKIGYEALLPYLEGPTAMAFALADPVVAAKVLSDFAKKNDKLQLKACIFDGNVYDEKRFREIASLPSKDEIYAQTVGMVSAPLRSLVTVLNGVVASIVNVLDQIKEQKEN